MAEASPAFDPDCRRCPRLAAHLEAVRRAFPGYHAAPVPPFGAARPRLLIVGLAPGMHGANATGRPFTGDFAGILLYRTLHEFGYASAARSRSGDDGLVLEGCRITNAVKCLPPQNRPSTAEVHTCNDFLRRELQEIGSGAVVLALGGIAHKAVLRALGERQSAWPFAHGVVHRIPGAPVLVDSYHCSRYNTQTGRLTPEMFRQVFHTIDDLLS
ncbi:MAG: uracil-DNA glycosylase [Gammaproteobacteria bacterium]|nr:MAG: uracil-DNA glycosylase [Gammaproteobacteria bacterium]